MLVAFGSMPANAGWNGLKGLEKQFESFNRLSPQSRLFANHPESSEHFFRSINVEEEPGVRRNAIGTTFLH